MEYKSLTFPRIVSGRIVYESILLDTVTGKPSDTTSPEILNAYHWIRRNVHPLYSDPVDWDKWLESRLPSRRHDPVKVGNVPGDKSWNHDNEIHNNDEPTLVEQQLASLGPDSLMEGAT